MVGLRRTDEAALDGPHRGRPSTFEIRSSKHEAEIRELPNDRRCRVRPRYTRDYRAPTPPARARAGLPRPLLQRSPRCLRRRSSRSFTGTAATTWATSPSIPALHLHDGPQGVANGNKLVTCWPAALTVVQTWDEAAMAAYGQGMGREHYLKGSNVMLGPGVNLARVPWNGRNFECVVCRGAPAVRQAEGPQASFCPSPPTCPPHPPCARRYTGEDPFLAARMVHAEVIGIQSQNVSGCVKHYVCVRRAARAPFWHLEASRRPVVLRTGGFRPLPSLQLQQRGERPQRHECKRGRPRRERAVLQALRRGRGRGRRIRHVQVRVLPPRSSVARRAGASCCTPSPRSLHSTPFCLVIAHNAATTA